MGSVVFSTVFTGSLTLSSNDTGPSGGPEDFDITLTLATPFNYDPSQGSLLMDVRNFAPSTSDGSVTFDADDTFGDETSRVVARDVTSTSADFADSIGLVTQFVATPVTSNTGGSGGASLTPLPPATLAFPGLALLAAYWLRRLRPSA